MTTDISVTEQLVSFGQFYNKSSGEVEGGFLSINNLLEDGYLENEDQRPSRK